MLLGLSGYSTFILFANVTVPQGATITDCTVTIYCQTAYALEVDYLVHFEDADEGTTITSRADGDSRSWTTGTSGVLPNPWYYLASHTTPDMSSDMQEITDRAGWSSGNDLLWMIEPDADADYKSIGSWELSNALGDYYATLHIEWTPAATGWAHDVGGTENAGIGSIGGTNLEDIGSLGGTE
jgi:hypothetical protein